MIYDAYEWTSASANISVCTVHIGRHAWFELVRHRISACQSVTWTGEPTQIFLDLYLYDHRPFQLSEAIFKIKGIAVCIGYRGIDFTLNCKLKEHLCALLVSAVQRTKLRSSDAKLSHVLLVRSHVYMANTSSNWNSLTYASKQQQLNWSAITSFFGRRERHLLPELWR